eukprot:3939344-Pyramimonas_sp.AAC.1
MVDQTAASCSVQWVSCMNPILPLVVICVRKACLIMFFVRSRALEAPVVPAAQFERAGLSGIGDCVDQSP